MWNYLFNVRRTECCLHFIQYIIYLIPLHQVLWYKFAVYRGKMWNSRPAMWKISLYSRNLDSMNERNWLNACVIALNSMLFTILGVKSKCWWVDVLTITRILWKVYWTWITNILYSVVNNKSNQYSFYLLISSWV